jgi:hypothetical protein
MERGKAKDNTLNRLTSTQLKQKVIYLQSELLKYKRKLKRYKSNEKYKNINQLRSEREKLDYLLKEQLKKNEEIEAKYEKLRIENEKYKNQFVTNKSRDIHDETKNESNNQEIKELLTERVNSFSEKLGLCMNNHEQYEKWLKNHDKELAKIELLLKNIEEYSKDQVEKQLISLKTKVAALEEKITNEQNPNGKK